MDLGKLKAVFLDIFFPTRCVSCGKLSPQNQALCDVCFSAIEIRSGFYCPKCGNRLPEAKSICHKTEKFILAAATSYQIDAVRELIHAFKYNGLKIAARTLEELIKKYLQKVDLREVTNQSWLVLPVPLHPKKERERGFNQAASIAEILSREFKVPVSRALVRIKNSPPQVQMKNYEERTKNLEGSFMLAVSENVKNKNIILVDDVFTSGATMREAVRVLKNGGARKIIAFVIAKA